MFNKDFHNNNNRKKRKKKKKKKGKKKTVLKEELRFCRLMNRALECFDSQLKP